MPEHDPVNHPKHYNSHPSGIECIDVVEHMNFNRGNAIKYIWRAGEKGDELEDLHKAIWYITRELTRIERERHPLIQTPWTCKEGCVLATPHTGECVPQEQIVKAGSVLHPRAIKDRPQA